MVVFSILGTKGEIFLNVIISMNDILALGPLTEDQYASYVSLKTPEKEGIEEEDDDLFAPPSSILKLPNQVLSRVPESLPIFSTKPNAINHLDTQSSFHSNINQNNHSTGDFPKSKLSQSKLS